MRCLWLTRKFPHPANSGELIYSAGLVASLGKAGADLKVIAHDNDEQPVGRIASGGEFRHEEGVRWQLGAAAFDSRAWSLLTTLPSDSYRLRGGGLGRMFESALASEPWDAVIVDHAAMGWALTPFLNYRRQCPPEKAPKLVYVSHNYEARVRREVASHAREPFPWNLALKWDARKYARQERALCGAADLVTAITDAEAEAYRREFPDKPYLTLTPGYSGEKSAGKVISDDTPRRVVMTGSFEWIAKRINLERFLEVAEQPFAEAGIELQIVGKSDEAFRRRIAAKFPSIDFVGKVLDVIPYLQSARMGLIVEIVGGGFKLKSLDYVFNGLPIAGLTEAVEGLPLDNPDDILLESFLPKLVRDVVEIVDDFERLNCMRVTAFRKCARAFEWDERGVRLASAIDDLTSSSSSRMGRSHSRSGHRLQPASATRS